MTNLPALPACVTEMGCLCARHAIQGASAFAAEPCNASEDPADWQYTEALPTDVQFLASLPAAIDLEHGRDASDGRRFEPSEVATAIRRDLKLAVKAGLIPRHAKFSVTRDGYKSINVELTAWQGAVLHAGYIELYMEALTNGLKDGPTAEQMNPIMSRLGFEWNRREGTDARMTDEINDVMWLVDRIVGRHNYDNSDSMVDHFDVGYYETISARGLISLAENGLKLELDPATRELLRRAHDAANRVGPKVVRSICGKGGVDVGDEYAITRLLKLDATANGRPLVYNGRGWVVDTSAPVPPATPETPETK